MWIKGFRAWGSWDFSAPGLSALGFEDFGLQGWLGFHCFQAVELEGSEVFAVWGFLLEVFRLVYFLGFVALRVLPTSHPSLLQ